MFFKHKFIYQSDFDLFMKGRVGRTLGQRKGGLVRRELRSEGKSEQLDRPDMMS
jgi:hypothetical protein